MSSTWAQFTCGLVFLVMTSAVCCFQARGVPKEGADSHSDDMKHSKPSAASLHYSEHHDGFVTGGDEARRTSSEHSTARVKALILHSATNNTESNIVKGRDENVDNDKVGFDDIKSSRDSDEENDGNDKHKNNHNDMKKRRKTNEKSHKNNDDDDDYDDNDEISNLHDDDDDVDDDDDDDDDDDKHGHHEKRNTAGETNQRERETVGVTFAVILISGVMHSVTVILVFLYCFFTHRRDKRNIGHRTHDAACNTSSLEHSSLGCQSQPLESPVTTVLRQESLTETMSREDMCELVDEVEDVHASDRKPVQVEKSKNKGPVTLC